MCNYYSVNFNRIVANYQDAMSDNNGGDSKIRQTLKDNPRLLGMLAGFLVLVSKLGVVAANGGASSTGP